MNKARRYREGIDIEYRARRQAAALCVRNVHLSAEGWEEAQDAGALARTATAQLPLDLTLPPGSKFHFVFSNKTQHDPLVLEVAKDLKAQGLAVWQQTTNIPKDSENWFQEWCALPRIEHAQLSRLSLTICFCAGTRARSRPRRLCATCPPTTSSPPSA